MNIKVNSMERVALNELKPGDTFISGSHYFIKTDERYHNQENTSACVELEEGIMVSYPSESEVTPISLTVIETPEPEG